jgi:uncharacterized protein (DUF58 family)
MKKLLRAWWRWVLRWFREPRVIWRSESATVQTTIEIRQWLPFLMCLFLFGWYIASPVPVVLMSLVTLAGILAAAFLWARMIAKGVRGERRLRFAAMQVGDELEEQISLENRTPLPVIWAEYQDRSNIPGYTVSSARAAEATSHISWRAHTICTRRGIFTLGPWELKLGEPFGFLVVRQIYLQRQEILVYPPLTTLPEQVLPHHGALGDHRPLNQPLRAETIVSSMVRAYVPGDPLRQIHWRTTARRADPFVKVFAPEAASNIWLVPDFDQAVHIGEGEDSSQEMMVTVIASLAARLLQLNLAVGLLASAEKETVVLPRQGQPHLWPILQAIAPLHTVPDRPLENILSRAHALISGNDLLILVTPSLNLDWVSPLRRISRSRGSRGRAEVILLDLDSFVPPASGNGSKKAGAAGRIAPGDFTAAQHFMTVLIENGITTSLLRREDISVISGYYGEISRWEFSVLGTGRAIARRTPRAAEVIAASQTVSMAQPPEKSQSARRTMD